MKSILVRLLLLSFVLSSCARSTSSSTYTSDSNTLFDTHLTISIGYWNIDKLKKDGTPDAILAYIEELFNITIEPISVGWSDYEDRYNIMATSNSLPDVFATNFNSGQNSYYTLNSLIQSDKIRALPSDLSNYPHVEDVILTIHENKLINNEPIYTIPRISFIDSRLSFSDAAMLVRKDWMETLGISDPLTVDEFIDMVVSFAKDDPNGSGINDTIGYNVNNRLALGKWLILGIAPQCNTYTWVETEYGFIPSYILPEFEEVVKTYRTLYEKGGLDPNFYTKKANDATDDFVRGKLGALEYKSSPVALTELQEQWNKFNPDKPFDECVKILPIFPASDGIRYSNTSSLSWSESVISSTVSDEKLERILALYEYLLSDTGWMLTQLGLEGVDYIMENGVYHSLIDSTDGDLQNILLQKYPSLSLFTNLASWGGSWNDFQLTQMNYQRYGHYITQSVNQDLLWHLEHTTPVERPYDFLSLSFEDTNYFTTAQVIDDLTLAIIGTEDPTIMWQNTIESYFNNGLEEYISQKNEEAKALGICPNHSSYFNE